MGGLASLFRRPPRPDFAVAGRQVPAAGHGPAEVYVPAASHGSGQSRPLHTILHVSVALRTPSATARPPRPCEESRGCSLPEGQRSCPGRRSESESGGNPSRGHLRRVSRSLDLAANNLNARQRSPAANMTGPSNDPATTAGQPRLSIACLRVGRSRDQLSIRRLAAASVTSPSHLGGQLSISSETMPPSQS